eukprot:gnl/MRDRNA2_/MRDRNA2_81201_c0_seq1.p1 gnl/MRDRNA2_/MRDRNA2_81201_c0~~gnl/MRDRNA2_/MRDRNA2_81201_c0_seq1.p1  ORF type:complete len:232 (-),score=15.09 gnl/MRDRNA2_/MRDRNA2_81201_c0_seq1:28-723(-)
MGAVNQKRAEAEQVEAKAAGILLHIVRNRVDPSRVTTRYLKYYHRCTGDPDDCTMEQLMGDKSPKEGSYARERFALADALMNVRDWGPTPLPPDHHLYGLANENGCRIHPHKNVFQEDEDGHMTRVEEEGNPGKRTTEKIIREQVYADRRKARVACGSVTRSSHEPRHHACATREAPLVRSDNVSMTKKPVTAPALSASFFVTVPQRINILALLVGFSLGCAIAFRVLHFR